MKESIRGFVEPTDPARVGLARTGSKVTLMIFMAKFSPVILERTRLTTANPPVPSVSSTSYLSSGWPAWQFIPSTLVDASARLPPPSVLRLALPSVLSAPAGEDEMHPMVDQGTDR